MTGLAPGFDAATMAYQVVGNDNGPATVVPTATDPAATVVVSSDGADYGLVGGAATVPLTRGR